MSGTQIAEQLKAADIITIFRHQRPDCDALGAQFGMKYWLQENFPDKTVLALGLEQGIQGDFLASDTADDDIIRHFEAMTDQLARIREACSLTRPVEDSIRRKGLGCACLLPPL